MVLIASESTLQYLSNGMCVYRKLNERDAKYRKRFGIWSSYFGFHIFPWNSSYMPIFRYIVALVVSFNAHLLIIITLPFFFIYFFFTVRDVCKFPIKIYRNRTFWEHTTSQPQPLQSACKHFNLLKLLLSAQLVNIGKNTHTHTHKHEITTNTSNVRT